MFTGIVSGAGTVTALVPAAGDALRLALACDYDMRGIAIGDSVACDGACLTVVEKSGRELAFDVSRETLARTTLGGWARGREVNLELAARAGDPLGGHIVTGHVDAAVAVLDRQPSGESLMLGVALPPALARFVAEKGSVTLNGVSLTVNKVEGSRFWVNIIPHTLTCTNLGTLQPGGLVNLEVDILARYLDRLRHADD